MNGVGNTVEGVSVTHRVVKTNASDVGGCGESEWVKSGWVEDVDGWGMWMGGGCGMAGCEYCSVPVV